jgi:hypothetical protein
MLRLSLLILFIAFNMILAYFDASKINQNTRIYHGINGLVYTILLALAYVLTKDWLIVTGLTILRVPVFNTALNYFRGSELTHLSSTTTSIIDQLTNRIPEKVGYWTYHTVLLVASLILILL